MDDQQRLLLLLKERWIKGEIAEEQFLRMKRELIESDEGYSQKAAFDIRSTLAGIGSGTVLKERYEIVDELGRGGMGVVYRAKDWMLETDVAIKVLSEELASDPRAIRSLKEEAKVSMCLSHPNIMRLHTFEEEGRSKFLVMELINGETLQVRLEREGKLAEDMVRGLALQICEGLSYAHAEKIIHRDLKPSNIMVEASGRVKITDFGIARVMKDSMTLVTGRQRTGTLVYMSPEQIEGRGVDQRTDIYSLGVLLYELISGKPPFFQGDITHQHLRVRPNPLSCVSVRMNENILKCLEKNREERIRNANELKSAFTEPFDIMSLNCPVLDSKERRSESDSSARADVISGLWEEHQRFLQDGNSQLAEERLEKILAIEPQNEQAKLRLKEIAEKAGNLGDDHGSQQESAEYHYVIEKIAEYDKYIAEQSKRYVELEDTKHKIVSLPVDRYNSDVDKEHSAEIDSPEDPLTRLSPAKIFAGVVAGIILFLGILFLLLGPPTWPK